MQRMLQLNLLFSERSGVPPRPLTEMNLKLWKIGRTQADANCGTLCEQLRTGYHFSFFDH